MEASEATGGATRDDQPRLFAPDPHEHDIYALIDEEWRVVAVSDRTRDLLGFEVDAAIGEKALVNVHPADADRAGAVLAEVASQPGLSLRVHLRARPGVGPWHEFDLRVTNLLHEAEVAAIVVEGDDVTEQSRAEIATHLQAQVLDRLPVAVVVTDADGVIVYWNGQAERLFGFRAEEALGRTVTDLEMSGVGTLSSEVSRFVQEHGRWEGERDIRRKDGELLPVLLTVESIDLPEVGFRGVVSACIDNGERRELQDALAHRALHDPLTGLPNRTLFLDRLDHALHRLQRERGMVAVLFLDLDRFKIINDTSGHEAGDEVLRSVAALFEGVVRPGDTVARLGGDEFAVCCEHLHDVGEALAVAERLAAAVSQPFVVAQREFYVSPSIGVVVGTGAKGESASTLLRDADAAMYSAKEKGRGRVELFDRAMRSDIVRRAEIAAELRRALHPPQFRLHFQPLVGVDDGRLLGFEALLRWEHPERGLLPPSEFIDVAEETNLIVPMGRWVVEESVRQLAAWRDELAGVPITISVNLSARQIADHALVPVVRDALAAQQVDPASLCLEITESVLMEDASASVATLRSLKAIGVQLAIDDFGTGYSSLAYLRRFPVDHLKVDRSFVQGIGRSSEDSVIVKAVVDLGAALGLDVVAEGVETVEQLEELRRLGCESGQGYLWSPPIAADEVVGVVLAWDPEERCHRASSAR